MRSDASITSAAKIGLKLDITSTIRRGMGGWVLMIILYKKWW
jgi:hypothetical protein